MDRLKYVMVKYRYVLLVVLAGLVLMLLPDHTEAPEPIADVVTEESLQAQLEEILSRVEGAGKVAVLLTGMTNGRYWSLARIAARAVWCGRHSLLYTRVRWWSVRAQTVRRCVWRWWKRYPMQLDWEQIGSQC